ncbi:hypothetical protein UVI_02024350 [Ustilaginoidea virens]|uniref:Uncharacterized protein n=1 Tax=Ustilaginoidea virens TaxID=1159556 RepID=A0A1B5KQV2_USTVR|nr:hypothetical protein UVI_02024350 [Ustilaginoidea virens]
MEADRLFACLAQSPGRTTSAGWSVKALICSGFSLWSPRGHGAVGKLVPEARFAMVFLEDPCVRCSRDSQPSSYNPDYANSTPAGALAIGDMFSLPSRVGVAGRKGNARSRWEVRSRYCRLVEDRSEEGEVLLAKGSGSNDASARLREPRVLMLMLAEVG